MCWVVDVSLSSLFVFERDNMRLLNPRVCIIVCVVTCNYFDGMLPYSSVKSYLGTQFDKCTPKKQSSLQMLV